MAGWWPLQTVSALVIRITSKPKLLAAIGG